MHQNFPQYFKLVFFIYIWAKSQSVSQSSLAPWVHWRFFYFLYLFDQNEKSKWEIGSSAIFSYAYLPLILVAQIINTVLNANLHSMIMKLIWPLYFVVVPDFYLNAFWDSNLHQESISSTAKTPTRMQFCEKATINFQVVFDSMELHKVLAKLLDLKFDWYIYAEFQESACSNFEKFI